jgi:hypothetical protein
MLRAGAASGLCVVLFELGCAAIVDFPDDPQLVAEAALTAQAGWRCLAEPTAPPEPSAPTARVRAMACDALRGCSAPATGLTARVCSKIDVDCTTPLLEGLHDVGGVFEFEVPTTIMGFDGYLEVSSNAEPCTSAAFGEASPFVCGLVPQCDPQAPDASCNVPVYPRFLHFFNPPITEDTSEPALVTLLPMAGLLGILGATGGSFDATTGILIVTARDCDGMPAAGVEYELGEAELSPSALYMDNGVLSSARDATDISGIGGFVGVPRGYSNVEAYAGSGERIGGVGVQIAPGSITNITLTPSP